MQTAAPVGSIAVTEATRKLCEGYFMLKPLGATRVKGVSEPVNVHEVSGFGPLRTRLQRAAGRGFTKFVGRSREMEAMKAAAAQAQAGHGQIVAAIAEPGVGKSRLLFEFKAVTQSGWMVLETFSVSHGKASPFLPVIDVLHGYFRITGANDARARREKVTGRVLALDRSLEDTLPYLFALLGIVEGEDPLAQMDAQIRRRRTLEAIKRILIRESLNQPLMVIFEDLHWIDDQTQALLNLLADSIGTAKILLLVNYRPEYHHQWGSKTYYTQLRLDPLGRESAAEMLQSLLGDSAELRALKRLIIEKTEGNPFFMEETVEVLLDDGALVRNGRIKLVKPLAELKIPPTVQAILASRIDRLPADEKDLLQTLAVIGREFALGLLRSVADKSEDELSRMLHALQLAEFIYEQPAAGDIEYTFKQALTQEVAYNSVLTERRRILHGRIGATLEKLHANRLEDHLPKLAHHFGRGSDTAKAVEYLLKAGQNAAQRSAPREALQRFEAGLRLLESLPAAPARDQQELAIRVAMWVPLFEVRGPAAADNEVNLSRARELCDQTGAPITLICQVLNGLWAHYWAIASFEMARSLAGQLRALGEERDNDIARLTGYIAVGTTCTWTGEYSTAATSLDQGIAICERLFPGLPEPMLRLVKEPLFYGRSWLTTTLWTLGYAEQTLRQLDRMQALPERLLSSYDRAVVIVTDLLTRLYFLRDYRGGREKAEALIALARENGFSFFEPSGLLFLGVVAVQEGAIDEGIRTMLQAREA